MLHGSSSHGVTSFSMREIQTFSFHSGNRTRETHIAFCLTLVMRFQNEGNIHRFPFHPVPRFQKKEMYIQTKLSQFRQNCRIHQHVRPVSRSGWNLPKKRQICEHIKAISNDVLNLQKIAKIVKSANMLGPYLKENAGEKSSESSVPPS